MTDDVYSSNIFGGEASIAGMCGVVEVFGNNSNKKINGQGKTWSGEP